MVRPPSSYAEWIKCPPRCLRTRRERLLNWDSHMLSDSRSSVAYRYGEVWGSQGWRLETMSVAAGTLGRHRGGG